MSITTEDVNCGDVVTLNSGGNPMTVLDVNADYCRCTWMMTDGQVRRESFRLDILTKIDN